MYYYTKLYYIQYIIITFHISYHINLSNPIIFLVYVNENDVYKKSNHLCVCNDIYLIFFQNMAEKM